MLLYDRVTGCHRSLSWLRTKGDRTNANERHRRKSLMVTESQPYFLSSATQWGVKHQSVLPLLCQTNIARPQQVTRFDYLVFWGAFLLEPDQNRYSQAGLPVPSGPWIVQLVENQRGRPWWAYLCRSLSCDCPLLLDNQSTSCTKIDCCDSRAVFSTTVQLLMSLVKTE